jgi:hypothetical protein
MKSKKTGGITLFILFFFFALFTSEAQVTSEKKIPIIQFLQELENRFEVRFSYSRNSLREVKISSPDSFNNIEENLNYISQNTTLQFKIIDNRYIAVIAEETFTLCGVIIDESTGNPLPDVAITIEGESNGVSTDSKGAFTLPNMSASKNIIINYLGFGEVTFPAISFISNNPCRNIFLKPLINTLDAVTISSFFTKGVSKTKTGALEITKDDFGILPNLIEPDVLQIAQTLPGVYSFDETASNINIRGGNNDETTILWDKARMYQSGHFFGLISAFNPNIIKKVAVYKSSTPAQYGENTSGIVAIETQDKIIDSVYGGASINLISTSLFVNIPVDQKFSFLVSGRTSINTGSGNPVYKEFYNRIFQNTIITNLNTDTSQGVRSTDESFSFYDININALWDITQKDEIRYHFLVFDNQLEFTENFVQPESTISNVSNLQQNSNLNSLSWKRNWNPKLTSTAFGYNSNYSLNEQEVEIFSNTSQSQGNEVKEKGIQLDVNYLFNKNFSVLGGYQFLETEIVNTSTSPLNSIEKPLNTMEIVSYFLSINYSFLKKLNFSPSFRYNDYKNVNETFFEPRLLLNYAPNKELTVFVSAERKTQAIFQQKNFENKLLGIETRRWVVTDKNAPIIKSNQFTLGSTYSKKGWIIDIEAYLKKVDDIAIVNQGFRNQFQNEEGIGNYIVKGTEITVNKKTKNLSVWLSYALSKNEYTFNSLSPATFPNNLDVRHTANLAANYQIGNFNFASGLKWNSGLPYTIPVEGTEITQANGENNINFNDPNAETLKDYFRLDFSAEYRFKIDPTFSGKLNIALINLLDRKNALDTYYTLNTDANNNVTINRVDQFSLGFTPNVSFQLFF